MIVDGGHGRADRRRRKALRCLYFESARKARRFAIAFVSSRFRYVLKAFVLYDMHFQQIETIESKVTYAAIERWIPVNRPLMIGQLATAGEEFRADAALLAVMGHLKELAGRQS